MELKDSIHTTVLLHHLLDNFKNTDSCRIHLWEGMKLCRLDLNATAKIIKTMGLFGKIYFASDTCFKGLS